MKIALLVILSSLATGQLHAADKADVTTEEGIAAFKAGNYDLAIEKYSATLKKNPKNAIVYNDRGLAYRANKDYAHAIADYSEALRLKPEWYVYYNRAIAYDDIDDEDSAIADFTRALARVPRGTIARFDCLVERARSYFNKKETEPAMTDLNAAIRLGIKEPDAYVLRGILYKVRHDYARSLTDYEKAIALDPKDARSYDTEAYLLSVCPAPKFRDGPKAVAYGSRITSGRCAARFLSIVSRHLSCSTSNWEKIAARYGSNTPFGEACKRAVSRGWWDTTPTSRPIFSRSPSRPLIQSFGPIRSKNWSFSISS